jgi:hypothetical protein
LAVLANTAELMHSRECWVPRISSEEVVAKVGIEGIADSEAVKVAEWLQFSTAAVCVCGLECPLYAYVSVFIEAELRGAATEVEGFVVTRRRATCVWVAPGRTALLAWFESKRGCCAGRCQKRGDGCKRDLHDSGPRRRGMSKYIRVQGTSNLNTGADTTIDVTAGPMHQNYTQTISYVLDATSTTHNERNAPIHIVAKTAMYNFQEVPRRSETIPMGISGLAGDHVRAARSLLVLALQVNLRIRS